MSTRNNIDIYEDIARLGESVKEQDRIGWQKIEEAWQKLQKYCNEKTINFGRYLTDSKMTIDYLVNECCKPGAFSLLVAPCDSGKTKTILEEFATAILDDHNLAITTPTTLQSEQNAKMYFATGHNGEHFKTKAITGASRETINLSLRNAYSVVFDSVKRLEQKSDEELKKLVLVVDEAHQFETAKSYRNPTILMLWRVVNRVLAAGGSVIFMTGTPSKILALPYNNRATFVQGDVNLSRDSASLMRPNQKHNYGKIEVIRKDSHEFNMPELIASTMAKLILEGKTPFVRINDKNSIAAVAHALALSGKKIITLTADDKGCKFVETNQGREIIYDSPVYANIMNKGVISKCDGFITTSLLEVGTSIKGIEDEDGTVLQPETMVPIFACMNPTDCDTDAMEQFFARLRFPFEEAMILMNTPEERKYSSEQINFKRIAGALYNMAENHAEVLNKDAGHDHMSLTRINRRSESELTMYDGRQFVVDVNGVLARAYQLHDIIINLFPGETVEMLKERFGVPVTQTTVKGTAPYNFNKNREIPEATLQEIENIKNGNSVCSLGALHDVMTNPLGGQHSADILEPLRMSGHDSENPEDAAIGMTLIRAAQLYFACGIYSAADCIDMAVQKVSRPHSKLVCPSTDKPVNVSLDKQHGLFEVLSHFTMVEQDRFLDAYNLYHTANSKAGAKYNHTDPLFMFKGETHYILANNMDSPMLADFVVLMGRYRNYSDWRRTCLGAMHMSEEDFHAYVQSVIFTRWNKLEYNTPEYIMAVQPGTSIIGTEYEILRFPWHAFHYFDEETARRIAEDPDYINSDEFPGEYYWFCDGLIGATLTPYDIRNIAKCICPEINKRNPAAHAHVVYKPEDVYYAIKSIYTVKEEMTDDGLQLTIVGLRQRAIKLCAPKTEEINSTRNDMFRQMDEIIIDGRICLDDKRKRIGSLLHDGMANGCFTRRFVDRFMDELNKLPAFCGRAYQFNYEPGMTLAFYALMESQPQLPCTLQEIAETEFGTKDIIVNPVALDLKEKITTFLRPAAYEGKMFTFDELEALNALSVQLESLALVLNARNELMLMVKRATEQCLDSEKISFVWKGAVRQAVYDENHTDNAPALPENAAKTNVNLIFDDPRIVDSYRWYTMLYIISHDRSHSSKIVA